MNKGTSFIDLLLLGGLTVYILLFVWIPVPGIVQLCVTSGSMEPAIKEGDMVYIQKCHTEEIIPGDIIAFETGNTQLVLHRVSEVTEEGVLTKGDANRYNDFVPVKKKNIKGKLVAVLKRGGIWQQRVSSPEVIGMITAYLVCKCFLNLFFYVKKRFFF